MLSFFTELSMLDSASMLVVAVQFFTGDWFRAMKLARLLADFEQRRRDDVCLLFVRTTECPATRVLDDVVARCSEVFHVESLVVRPDTPERRERWGLLGRWPVGANVLWQGAVEYFLHRMDSRWSTLFTVDGGDSVPTCREWLDVLLEDHAKTVAAGLGVTGQVGMDGIGRWHVNLNQVVERTFLNAHPEVVEMPVGVHLWEPIDMYRAGVFLPECRASTVIRSDWRYVGASLSDFTEVSRNSAWWHGCKDGNFVDLAREYVFGGGGPRSRPLDLGRATDFVASVPKC
jgi:hypothetical protein